MTEIAKPKLHIAFDLSSAGSIAQALRSIGSDDRVIGLIDDLSFGPIDSPTAEARAEWVENAVGCEFLEVVQRAEFFWRDVVNRYISAITWVCFDDAQEYCGFLEFVWKVGKTPFNVIDATGLELTDRFNRKWTPRSLGVISPEKMIEAGLIGRARPLRRDEIERYRRLWGRLRTENAPLRIVTPKGLTSAPIYYFDHWLTRNATNEWRKGARIVGEAMGELWQSEESPHVSDIWLWGRVCALAEEGVLEVKGNSAEMRSAMVRRSSNASKVPQDE